MAAAPLIGVAMGAAQSASSLAAANKQKAAQQRQLDIQATNVRDQKILSEYQIDEQQRQVDALGQRERLLGLQAQTLGLIQNEMQAAQQNIAQTQAQIANDQAAFLNTQKAVAREVSAHLQSAETMRQLQSVLQKAQEETNKTEQEASAIAAQRLLLQGAGSADTQSGQALLDRVANAIASGAINSTSLFNNELSDAEQQILYEQLVAGLEKELGNVGVNTQSSVLKAAERLNEMQRQANIQNINTQTARNESALDYALASQRAQLKLAKASNSTNAKAQLDSIQNARQSIAGPGFADYLGAIGNLGLGLYQSGIFGGRGNTTPTQTNMSIMTVPQNRTVGLFNKQQPTNRLWAEPGANDLTNSSLTRSFG